MKVSKCCPECGNEMVYVAVLDWKGPRSTCPKCGFTEEVSEK